jgi:hypothetical protein
LPPSAPSSPTTPLPPPNPAIPLPPTHTQNSFINDAVAKARGKHYQLACALAFEGVAGVPHDTGINRPSDYYAASVEAAAPKAAAAAGGAPGGVAATPARGGGGGAPGGGPPATPATAVGGGGGRGSVGSGLAAATPQSAVPKFRV